MMAVKYLATLLLLQAAGATRHQHTQEQQQFLNYLEHMIATNRRISADIVQYIWQEMEMVVVELQKK